ncbi:AMP-binding domain-containing protein [Fusarium sp. LHS14.1]|nr:AMP-binding domain-containing protein [Fusarium sp. LHS14.1]
MAPSVSPSIETPDQQVQISEVFGSPVPDLHLTIWDLFLNAATLHPHQDVIVSLWQPCDSPEDLPRQAPDGSDVSYLTWSYSQLRDKAERLAESLQTLGCLPGMRLAVVLCNSAEWGLFFWVAAKLQMAFVPIDATVIQDSKTTIISVRPHVVVVQDAKSATALDLSKTFLSEPSLCILCSGEDVDGWVKLCDVSTVQRQIASISISNVANSIEEHDDDQAALIVFTSGTTGEPKGCWHTTRNLVSQCCDFDPEVNTMGPLRWLVHTPVSHIFAINNSLRAWRWGGTAVFPSRTFNVDATLDALVREQCSVMSATPTLVKALMAHPSFPAVEKLDLRIVTIGGTFIGPEDIRLCRQGLGAKCAIQVYGMSEGAPVITWQRKDPDLVDGWHPGVGKVLPGAAARICKPGTREILPRLEIGELHIGGTSVITKYLNKDNDSAMYQDEAGSWLMTGDQARMDEKGVIYILGRYKDLIIRGGENIYPAKIEHKLQEIDGLQVQVVGVPDDLAGQVPVAIVILPEGATKAQVGEKSRSTDPRYALDEVYTLQELDLKVFPTTALGKVKKQELKKRVLELRQKSQSQEPQPSTKAPSQSFVDKLLDIWDKLTGTRPTITESVKYLADSITLLRYCDNVLRACGQRLYLQDFAENDTVEKQAHLLLSREMQQLRLGITSNPPTEPKLLNQPHLPPSPRQDQNLPKDTKIFTAARKAVIRAGLSASDIEDILPIRASLHRTAIGPRPQSYHSRMVFRVVGNVAQQEQIRRAVERALASRPMLRTIVFPGSDGAPFHAVLSPGDALFGQIVREVDVETEDEGWKRFKDDTAQGHSSPFMFQGELIKVDSGQIYLCFNFNHSVIDALSLTQWHHELDRWIQDIKVNMPALTPYRLFSDLFSQYEESEPAQKSVSFHVKRLRGISRFNRALWPPQRAPGMMICNDEGGPYVKERSRIRDRVWSGEWDTRAHEFQYPRSGRVVALPGLASMKERYGIHPSLFAKSAIILFNVLQTGSSHAFVNVWESGRSWPFVPSWMEKLLPPAMSIDGPTVQWILNMAEVVRNETLLEFLQRMDLEQEQIREHEHAPWNKVVQALRDEGDAAVEASFRQAFVWDVSMAMSLARGDQSDFTNLEPIARYDWPDCGYFWNAFMIDSVNLYFIASWDTAQMNDTEVDGHCDSLSDVMRKLADERNWEKSVGEVFSI